MDSLLELKNRIDRVENDLIFHHDYSQDYLNFKAEDGEQNWENYDRFTIGFTSLEIDWSQKDSLNLEGIKEELRSGLPKVYQSFIQWMFGSIRGLRFFPPRFFRQASLVHGMLSMHAEKLKILTLVQFYFDLLQPAKNFDPFNVLNNEIYFFKKENCMQRMDLMLFFLLQQAFVEKRVIGFLADAVLEDQRKSYEGLYQLSRHYEVQLSYLVSELHKLWKLSPELKETWDIQATPKLYYMEKFVDFGRLAKALEDSCPGWVDQCRQDFDAYCQEQDLGSRDNAPIELSRDFVLGGEEQKEYAGIMTDLLSRYGNDISKVVEELGLENDKILKQAYLQLQRKRSYSESFETGPYEYYLSEQKKVHWHLQDVQEYVGKLEKVEITDNDYELVDIIKEIAYCEGFSYTIGYQNMYHVGQMHPFALWNVQQCHEELKHYHAVRALLNMLKVRTNDLDEDFLATTFEKPDPEAYHDQYSVLMINLMGESHNIRAYRMLSDSFDNQNICEIMRWVAQDEVVHKKVFTAHFKYLCAKDKTWEKNSYECMIDNALGVHQAGKCDRYRVMMQKIGRYYAHSGKTDALKFLNLSMRAQYLELKKMFSPEIFKISEYDFRHKHLKAYVF
jgi:hypothetical protein